MTLEAEIAKDVGYQIECKKDGLRQVQSGDVKLSLTLNPQDIPPALYTDQMGQRYMMVLVPMTDTDTPRVTVSPSVRPQEKGGKLVPAPSPAPPRKWEGMSYAQRAGILCADKRFHAFLSETTKSEWPAALSLADYEHEKAAAYYLRAYCRVGSRAEIDEHSDAMELFNKLHASFQAWERYGMK